MAQLVKAKVELENGKKITHCQRLVIEQDMFGHHKFEMVVPFEELESEDESFFNQSHKNVCGKLVKISFDGVLKDEDFDFQFKGIITEISLNNQGDLSNVFIIKGYSPTILVEDYALRRAFHNKSVAQLFKDVLNVYPNNVLKKSINPSSKETIAYTVQYDESNFEYLSRVADVEMEWFYYNGQELILGESNDHKEVDFIINGAQSFDMSITLLPSKFKMIGYDYTKDEVYTGKSSGQSVDGLADYSKFALDESENLFSHESLMETDKKPGSQKELNEEIKARRSGLASELVVFQGHGENPDLSIGTVINVSVTKPKKSGRSGKESLGKYRITGIRHEVNMAGNYSNSFRAIPHSMGKPPKNPYVSWPTGELELATVIDNNDPDKLGRVKVSFLHWGADEKEGNESDWMRVGSFYTGGDDGKGSQFIPEKGAQVIVGYEFNNLHSPFVVTSLYPKKDGTRPVKGNNEEKVIYTKAGNIIGLIDEQGDNKIYISNVNNADTAITLEFNGNGTIQIGTNGKVEIEAKENIALNASKKLTLEAPEIEIKARSGLTCEGSSTKISGSNISIKADANLELKGGANAKLDGGAMAEVKGGMVKIN